MRYDAIEMQKLLIPLESMEGNETEHRDNKRSCRRFT